MKLTERLTSNDLDSWDDLQEHQYIFLRSYSDKEPCAIVFKCPGCKTPIHVSVKDHTGEPGWIINFETLTATPSIFHKRDGRGCGWHGYLTDGTLEGKIE